MSSISQENEKNNIEYVYKGRFNYERFLFKITPILHEYLVFPDDKQTLDDADELVMGEFQYDKELCDMFDIMGVGKYDGLSGVYETFDCTYVEVPILVSDTFETVWDTFPVNVNATVTIRPEGYIVPTYTIPI